MVVQQWVIRGGVGDLRRMLTSRELHSIQPESLALPRVVGQRDTLAALRHNPRPDGLPPIKFGKQERVT